MTLKEKFKKIDVKLSETHSTLITNREADIMETIADEFAIGFAEWLGKGMTCRLRNGNWIYNMELKASTTEELLQRYKKQKGL